MTDAELIAIAVLKVCDLLVQLVVGSGTARISAWHKSYAASDLHADLKDEAAVLVGLLTRGSAVAEKQRDVARARWHQIPNRGGQRTDDDPHLDPARVW